MLKRLNLVAFVPDIFYLPSPVVVDRGGLQVVYNSLLALLSPIQVL
jgi:hypothetical protein